MCGEHFRQLADPNLSLGSSPRVRGTRRRRRIGSKGQGIIPACAGNTCIPPSPAPAVGDHPRVCGEHVVGHGCSFCLAGIIPACAGNTRLSISTSRICRDHPRVCGEHASLDVDGLSAVGSSPRVRGTPCGSEDAHCTVGIIPACAGNTTFQPETTFNIGDHPRVCGEHRCKSV